MRSFKIYLILVLLLGFVGFIGGFSCKSCNTPTGPDLKPMIIFFTATPTEIASGQSATLSWNVFNATSVTIDQGIGGVAKDTGHIQVKPETTTSYKLAATNAAGTVFESVTVTIIPYPSEIVGEYRMGGGPVTLKGNRWEITLKSISLLTTLADPRGGTWIFEDKLVVWRWKIKLIWYDDFIPPKVPIPGSYLEDSQGNVYLGVINPPHELPENCFPGEQVVLGPWMALESGEVADNLLTYAEVRNDALRPLNLKIIWNDNEFLAPKQKPQKIIFRLILD